MKEAIIRLVASFNYQLKNKNRMAKLNMDIVLIDESVVMSGFRCLMSGAMLEQFKANPVMLCQHLRVDNPNKKGAILPIGKWYDIRIEGDKLKAKPDFDDADTFAMQVQGKVERGYLNAASISLQVFECDNDVKLKLLGQTLPTVTKWGILECSIVDIGSCRNALVIRNNSGMEAINLNTDTGINELRTYLSNMVQSKDNSGVITQNNDTTKKERVKELMKQSFGELLLNNGLVELQELDCVAYYQKYKDEMGKPHPNDQNGQVEKKQSLIQKTSIDSLSVKELMGKDWHTLWLSGESEQLFEMDKLAFFEKYKEGNGKDYPLKKAYS